MNRLENLFTVLESGDIEINKPELRRHALLKPIVAKQKTKDQIDKLMYIYLMSDVGSMYNHLQGDELDKAVREHFGYDDIWRPTPDMTVAVEAYRNLVDLSATGRAYKTAVKAVYETGKDLDRMLDMIVLLKTKLETRINNVQNDHAFTESEKFDNIKEAMAYMVEITSKQKDVIENVKKMPDLIKVVSTLATKFAEETSNKQEIHGGGELGNRE